MTVPTNIGLIFQEQQENIHLIIEEMVVQDTPHLNFEIEMLAPEAQPEVVVNHLGDQPIYTLKIPRGYPGERGLCGLVLKKTTAQWTMENPVLRNGELGYEIDTRFIKLGNGVQTWDQLEYLYENTTEDHSGFLSPDNLEMLQRAIENTDEVEIGDVVSLFENNLL